MKKTRFKIFIITLAIITKPYFAQTEFSYDSFKTRILQYHPIAKKANLQIEVGQATILKARGQLDPSISSDLSGKSFDNKEYYFLSNTGLKIPTWLGIDLKAGYEANRGPFVDGEHSTPGSGLWYGGISVPLGQGLFFDERRSAILQANWLQKSSENDEILILNDLLLDATQAYWNWFETYQKLKISQEGLNFANQRFQGVKQNAIFGDVPFIDTLEAKIQLDNRNFDLEQAKFDFKNAALMLEIYLWSDDLVPLELDSTAIPGNFVINLIQIEKRINMNSVDSLGNSVPILLNSAYKLEQLKIEERLKRDKLKPVVNVQYNPLLQPSGNQIGSFNSNNFKWGGQVYFPIFLRKERGDLKLTKLKIENSKLDLQYKQLELITKEDQLINDLTRLKSQLIILQTQVENTLKLKLAEEIRFEAGESSLFLVNTREVNYLSSKFKLAELQSKLKNSEAKYLWISSGLF